MKKKMKDVRVVPVSSDHIPDIRKKVSINDVHAYKVNPNEPTPEDLDVSWPSFRDRRFQ